MIRDLFNAMTPNPDLVGQVRVMESDIEPERLEAYAKKLDGAREYLRANNIEPKPIIRVRDA